MADNLRSVTDLPVLTEVPDGTYTVVVDGGVAKLAPYGGSKAIEIIYSVAEDETCTCNMTFEEIHEALMSSSGVANVKASMGDMGIVAGSSWWSFTDLSAYGVGKAFKFNCDTLQGLMTFTHNDEDVITMGVAAE